MKEKIKEYIKQYEKGGFTYKELEWELLNLYSVSNMLTVKEVLDILDDSEDLDDAKTLIRETVS